MKITIVNGNPESSGQLEGWLGNLTQSLQSSGYTVDPFNLREMKIRQCVGCWNCWVKTPGECTTPDDTPIILRSIIHSDLTIMASPVIMGFTSALLKRMNDKMIPLVHPYAVIDQNEIHHLKRYEHYPLLALALEAREDTDEEDISIIRNIYSRTALNMKSKLAFVHLIPCPVEEVCNEISHL